MHTISVLEWIYHHLVCQSTYLTNYDATCCIHRLLGFCFIKKENLPYVLLFLIVITPNFSLQMIMTNTKDLYETIYVGQGKFYMKSK